MHIFVSICSYRDPLLHKTIKSLMQEKSKRHKCTYSIFEQTAYNDSLEKKYPEFANHPDVIYKRIDPQYSDGCVWARYINLMNIRECHDFVYRVDSHMLFDKNWDMFLVEDYNMVAKIAGHDKVIITGACKEFSIDETGAEATYWVKQGKWPIAGNTRPEYLAVAHDTSPTSQLTHGQPVALARSLPIRLRCRLE